MYSVLRQYKSWALQSIKPKLLHDVINRNARRKKRGPDQINDSDVNCLVSFPKCGRTWLRMMLGQSMMRAYGIHADNPLDIQCFWKLDRRIPRITVVHEDDPFHKLADELTVDKSEHYGRRIVFLVRDPRDVLASAYFHKTKRTGIKSRRADGSYDPWGKYSSYDKAFEEFIDEPIGGLDTILRYFTLWHNQRNCFDRFELIRYEDLHVQPHNELRRIARMFELDAVGDDAISFGVQNSAFDNMRKLEVASPIKKGNLKPGIEGDPESYKTRKGKVGSYRELCSTHMCSRIDERIRKELPSEFGYHDPPLLG